MKYPSSLVCALSSDATRVAAVYEDRSMVVWDARDPKKKPIRATQAHSGGITDLQLLPTSPSGGK